MIAQLTNKEKDDIQELRDGQRDFLLFLKKLGNSRELSLAATKMEEATMWAIKHITKE